MGPIFHPNVYGDGSLCLDILQDKWSPIYDVSAILISIRVRFSRFLSPGHVSSVGAPSSPMLSSLL